MNYINETNFKRFVMIIRSAGFIDPSLIGSQNALNFAYILYLTMRSQDKSPEDIASTVRRWFVMSMLTGRYSGSPESTIDYDIRNIQGQGLEAYTNTVISGTLSDAFWETLLPQEMVTSAASSPYFRVYRAAQVKSIDKGFLSRDITVQDLILNRNDVHHIFPKGYLKNQGMSKGQYNQIANYVLTQSEINITIGDKPPVEYFGILRNQCNGGTKKYGAITDLSELKSNLRMHCIPESMLEMSSIDYDWFLQERRKLMARKIKEYFEKL
jgi:hypothetical protein